MARRAMLFLEFVWPSIAYQCFIYIPRPIVVSTQAHTSPPSVYPFYRLPIAEFTSLKMSKIRKELRLHDACDNIPKLLSTLTYT